MEYLQNRVTRIKLIYKLALVFIVGLLAALSMPPNHFLPFIFVGLSTLYIFVATATNNTQAFSMGYFFGLGYFGLGLYWIGNALLVEGNPYWWVWPLAVTGLPAMLSFFPAFACGLYRKYFSGTTICHYPCFVAVLSITEWLRGNILTGFPWNLYGYTWTNILPVVQTVAFSDIYFLTLLTIFWGTLPGYLLISQEKKVMKCGLTFLAVALFAFLYQSGANRLAENPTQYNKKYALVVVQPNIPQNEKWDSGRMQRNFEKSLSLSKFSQSPDFSSVEATYIIWPETALARFTLEKGWALAMISDMLKTYPMNAYLISGALRYEKSRDAYYNSIVLIDKNAQLLNIYNKNHLVPFGEYIPYGESLGIDPVVGFKGFQTGDGYRIDTTPEGLKYLPLVCYEIIFPNGFSHGDNRNADVIINVTNDGWYGISPGPYQHLAKAVFRAVETGIPVVRSANTGFTSVIDPHGRMVERSELFHDSVINIYLPESLVDKVKGGYTSIRSYTFLVTVFILLSFVICTRCFLQTTIE